MLNLQPHVVDFSGGKEGLFSVVPFYQQQQHSGLFILKSICVIFVFRYHFVLIWIKSQQSKERTIPNMANWMMWIIFLHDCRFASLVSNNTTRFLRCSFLNCDFFFTVSVNLILYRKQVALLYQCINYT